MCPPSAGLGAGKGRGPVACPPGLCPPSTVHGSGASNDRGPVTCLPSTGLGTGNGRGQYQVYKDCVQHLHGYRASNGSGPVACLQGLSNINRVRGCQW